MANLSFEKAEYAMFDIKSKGNNKITLCTKHIGALWRQLDHWVRTKSTDEGTIFNLVSELYQRPLEKSLEDELENFMRKTPIETVRQLLSYWRSIAQSEGHKNKDLTNPNQCALLSWLENVFFFENELAYFPRKLTWAHCASGYAFVFQRFCSQLFDKYCIWISIILCTFHYLWFDYHHTFSLAMAVMAQLKANEKKSRGKKVALFVSTVDEELKQRKEKQMTLFNSKLAYCETNEEYWTVFEECQALEKGKLLIDLNMYYVSQILQQLQKSKDIANMIDMYEKNIVPFFANLTKSAASKEGLLTSTTASFRGVPYEIEVLYLNALTQCHRPTMKENWVRPAMHFFDKLERELQTNLETQSKKYLDMCQNKDLVASGIEKIDTLHTPSLISTTSTAIMDKQAHENCIHLIYTYVRLLHRCCTIALNLSLQENSARLFGRMCAVRYVNDTMPLLLQLFTQWPKHSVSASPIFSPFVCNKILSYLLHYKEIHEFALLYKAITGNWNSTHVITRYCHASPSLRRHHQKKKKKKMYMQIQDNTKWPMACSNSNTHLIFAQFYYYISKAERSRKFATHSFFL
ncbi:hypothetical protein RFI_15768 [Reticulomyxa filosa]|uniref:Uncharacterized protein n=1 Tax=Reticulomyxa filosa TaxID=46433 RepID=X6N594_RETFI|nr:hypothetical protein RFI_15768 [Reticulomyxa filosa]|eukprot:ETO21435.1 hypothetical protein RFI_15768 [Reticulomyxa filosa]